MNKIKNHYRLLIALFFFTSVVINAQHEKHDHEQEHEGHAHGSHDYEFGISVGMAHLSEEDENAPSAHLHLLKSLGSEGMLSKFSLGAGFEYIFTEHTHYSIVGTISVNPISAFILDISPGLLFTEHDGESENQFVTHMELTYEFEFHGFGIGPVVGVGFAKEDNHLMAGIHIGKGF
ncbi:MAG: hypothetical protein JEY94_09640 [Melioribacteraceae bacterium]|nr:hypothetical protein [Melioribacteraceae bacterium]